MNTELWFTKVTSPASILILSAISSMSGLFTSLTSAEIQSPGGDEPGKPTVAAKGIFITWAGGPDVSFWWWHSRLSPSQGDTTESKGWRNVYVRRRRSREIAFRSQGRREVKQARQKAELPGENSVLPRRPCSAGRAPKSQPACSSQGGLGAETGACRNGRETASLRHPRKRGLKNRPREA